MGFSRQEYWSVLPCFPPGDLLDPRIQPQSPALAGRFFTSVIWEGHTTPTNIYYIHKRSHSLQGCCFTKWEGRRLAKIPTLRQITKWPLSSQHSLPEPFSSFVTLALQYWHILPRLPKFTYEKGFCNTAVSASAWEIANISTLVCVHCTYNQLSEEGNSERKTEDKNRTQKLLRFFLRVQVTFSYSISFPTLFSIHQLILPILYTWIKTGHQLQYKQAFPLSVAQFSHPLHWPLRLLHFPKSSRI